MRPRSPAPAIHRLPIPVLALIALAPAALAGQRLCPDRQAYDVVVPGPDDTQQITLEGGATYLGRVTDDGDPVRFELMSGDALEIARDRIICLRVVEGTRHDGEFWPQDPNTTRLFFGPTGRALRSGEGYFSVFEIVMPFLSVGATDRLTLSGGIPLIFGSGGIELAWLAPKYELLRTETFRGAVGVLAFFAQGESAGVVYGVGTLGRTSDRAVTVGAGWGYDSESGLYTAPALMLGFEGRAGKNVKFISENYLFPDEGFGILSAGPRFFGERLSADLGLALPVAPDMGGFVVFPLVNFVWNW